MARVVSAVRKMLEARVRISNGFAKQCVIIMFRSADCQGLRQNFSLPLWTFHPSIFASIGHSKIKLDFFRSFRILSTALIERVRSAND